MTPFRDDPPRDQLTRGDDLARGEIERWKDGGADTNALEDRAGALVTAAGDVAPLDAKTLARIRADVLARRSGSRSGKMIHEHRRFGARPAIMRIAVVAVLLLVSVTTAGGATILWRKYFRARPASVGGVPPIEAPATRSSRATRPRRPPAPEPESQPSPASESESQSQSREAAMPLVDPPLPSPNPLPAMRGEGKREALARVDQIDRVAQVDAPLPPPSPRPALRGEGEGRGARPPSPRSLALSPPPPPPDHTSPPPLRATPRPETEARLLGEALLQLRRDHDPHAALSTLGRYDLAFPRGVLSSEAFGARLEAVVQLNDLRSALALLDGVRTFSDPLRDDQLLTRAELRANASRCREALRDFNQFLALHGLPSTNHANERALYGRAICFGKVGDNDRARADLMAYRRYFPSGRFAPEVGRLLDGK